ncbi:MAG TPA: 2OG-Fe(II) oxygenase [Caulobacteraceae bacterium]|nr:2OG-Fe(II) oxygenase [Caulobacteraceae bacterium]
MTARAPDFGELAPLFTAEIDGVANYNIGVAGGRWIVLQAFGSLAQPACRDAYGAILARRSLFDDREAAYFGVSADRADRGAPGEGARIPGLRCFWDFDLEIFKLYGLVRDGGLQPAVFLIDRALRIVMAETIEATGAVLDELERRLAAERAETEQPFAPVLVLPRVFEPDFCARLIQYFEHDGGSESGFAAEVEGKTTTIVNPLFKRRQDATIEDEALLAETRARLDRRLLPMVKRAFNWQATEIERFLVCRYGASDQGFFSAHRDDATAGTAHRKFAVTINLNADDYDGGDLRFPEFGRRLYRPPTGGAVVFCCSLLHEVTPVTRGVRYCFVPFLYDADGANIREANMARVAV